MKIIKNGIKENFIIYKIYNDDKIYIGKTTIPIYIRINNHRHGILEADQYFRSVGWDNVTFEIIDYSNDRTTLLKKENEQIIHHYELYKDKILNKYNTHKKLL